jgi:signal transduction histidine kinase
VQTPFEPSDDFACTCELELATAAHDLRNRLGIALCELRQLRLRIDGPGVCEQLDQVERLLAQSTTLLEALLEHACSQTGLGAGVETPTVDLVEVVRALVSERGRLELSARVPQLMGAWDPHHAQHLVKSLLTNALQYSDPARSVIIELDRADGAALISVADRGIGIPDADLARILEPFFRGRNAEAVGPGLGLGLSTARLLVERYGGSLDADSVEGVGTTVRVRLPLVSTEVTWSNPVGRPTPRPGHDYADLDGPAHARGARAPSPD